MNYPCDHCKDHCPCFAGPPVDLSLLSPPSRASGGKLQSIRKSTGGNKIEKRFRSLFSQDFVVLSF